MNTNTSLFLSANDFARATPWLHGLLALFAGYGLVVFAGLLAAGWWIARLDGAPARMAAAPWAPLGTILAVAVNQPIVAFAHEQRPYDTLSSILLRRVLIRVVRRVNDTRLRPLLVAAPHGSRS